MGSAFYPAYITMDTSALNLIFLSGSGSAIIDPPNVFPSGTKKRKLHWEQIDLPERHHSQRTQYDDLSREEVSLPALTDTV